MQAQENLDKYQGTYGNAFKFFDENQWYLAKYADLMADRIQKDKLASILCLGIGFGVVTRKLLKFKDQNALERYEIVEGSRDIIDAFHNEYGIDRIKVHHSYFENFTTDFKFDAIEMGFVLEHVENPLFVLERYKKFLKKSGILFVAVPNAASLHRLIGYNAGILENLYELGPQDHDLGHKRYFDANSICLLLEEAGYNVLNKCGLMLKPITSAQMKQLNWDGNIINALMEIALEYPEISNCVYLEAQLK